MKNMYKLILWLGCLFIVSTGFSQDKYIIRYDTAWCESSGINEHTKLLRKKSNAAGRIKTATFIVDYDGFSAQAQTAFQHAVSIWETLIESPIPIRIQARWSDLEGPTLGNAIWGAVRREFEGGKPGVFYPVALAEKMLGEEINGPDDYDIIANFDSGSSWYFGLDGNTPGGTTDLVSVVLHEIGHGLGITDTFSEDEDNDLGRFGFSGIFPIIYDTHVINGSSEIIIDSYVNNSTEMLGQLTSKDLFFNSPIAAMDNGGVLPKIFAPTSFNGGSSIAHLDENTYLPGDINSLMTPQIGFAEAIHDPGPLILGMLAEMGWIHTYIDHTPIENTEILDVATTVAATITSDTELQPSLFRLHYSTDEFESEDISIPLVDQGNNVFSADIPADGTEKEIHYFIEAVDQYDRIYVNPSGGFHSFVREIDTTDPEIEMDEPTFMFAFDDSLNFILEATDAFGIESVILTYRLNEEPNEVVEMELIEDEEDMYIFTFQAEGLAIEDGDFIHYSIEVTDGSTSANTSNLPETGENQVAIRDYGEALNGYTNDFNSGSNDFVGWRFSVTRPAGFQNSAIHSEHPYEDGMDENDQSNYYYLLLNPIILKAEDAFIKFDEIALIEPGAPGTIFGHQDFWDYVIVEGSNDLGETWQIFLKGYDARANSQWEQVYNGNIVDNDSQANGTPALYRERVIDMHELADFDAGEEILIRFRLFADQAAHGWGWSIDNLAIQDEIVGLGDTISPNISAYPNPLSNGLLSLQIESNSDVADIKIINVLGTEVFSQKVNLNNGKTKLNLSALESGPYILQVKSAEKLSTTRLIINK